MSRSSQPPYITPFLPFAAESAESCVVQQADINDYLRYIPKEARFNLRYNKNMNAIIPVFGTQFDPILPKSSRSLGLTEQKRLSLQDLLVAIKVDVANANLLKMLRVAANKIAQFKGMPVEQVPVDVLPTLGAEFELHLKSRRYSDSTVRTYRHQANVLLAKATELGLMVGRSNLAADWESVCLAMAKKGGSANIIRYAISIGRKPKDFSLDDLRSWLALMQRQGRSYSYADKERSRFRGAMASRGYKQNLCDVYQSRADYGVPLAQLPEALRAEIEVMSAWKQARYAPGRRRGSRLRPVSAKKLTDFIRRFYGFATAVQKHRGINSLLDLVSQQMVAAYVEWYLNECQRKTNPLRSNLGALCAAMKQFPGLRGHDFSWFDGLVTNLEEDETEEEERQRRKERQSVPYDVLAEVSNKIRAIRLAGGHTAREAARLVHDELLLRWWTVNPWRQRNIRECRIVGADANVFKAELPSTGSIRKPEWVEEILQRNPRERFWQMRFSKQETKTGNEFQAIVQLDLVPVLEEYLTKYRDILLDGHDPGTLFVSGAGNALTDRDVVKLFEDLTFRYAGKAVNPHLLRDIFAYNWLDEHPEDFLTLSMILWHRSIKTTLRIYGRNFNESNGVCRVDEWLRRRNSSDGQIFVSMRLVATQKIADGAARRRVLETIDGLEQAAGSNVFITRYQEFVRELAEHISEFSGLLPGLARYMHDPTGSQRK